MVEPLFSFLIYFNQRIAMNASSCILISLFLGIDFFFFFLLLSQYSALRRRRVFCQCDIMAIVSNAVSLTRKNFLQAIDVLRALCLKNEEEEEKRLSFFSLSLSQTRGYALILIPSEKNKQETEETQLRTSETTTLDFFLLLLDA